MYFIFMVFSTIVCTLYKGFVLKTLWAWFIVPTFGLPALAMSVAIGVSLVVGLLAYQPSSDKSKSGTEIEQIGESMAWCLSFYTIILFMGWVTQLFM